MTPTYDERVLDYVRRHGEAYGYELSRRLGLSAGRVGVVLRRLEEAGLLVSESRPGDDRRSVVPRRYYRPVEHVTTAPATEEQPTVTDPAVYRDDVPLRRVALVVVCDVPAVTSGDAADVAEVTFRRALDVAPNRVRRGPAAARPTPTLRHLVNDRTDDPRDVHVVAVTDLRSALRRDHALLALVPLGDPVPLPSDEEEE